MIWYIIYSNTKLIYCISLKYFLSKSILILFFPLSALVGLSVSLWPAMCKQLHWTTPGYSRSICRSKSVIQRWNCCKCSATQFCCSSPVCWVSMVYIWNWWRGHCRTGSVSTVSTGSNGSTGSTICEVQAMSVRLHNLAITTRSHVPGKVHSSVAI